MPTWVLPLEDAAWEKPVPGAMFQLPDATKMYTFPDKDGVSKWTPDNPFLPASEDKHVDPLAYVGFSGSADLPKGGQMAFLLEVIAMQDSGSERFFWDGQYLICEWTGGASEAPAYGIARRSVHPTCREDKSPTGGTASPTPSTTGDLDAWQTFNDHVVALNKPVKAGWKAFDKASSRATRRRRGPQSRRCGPPSSSSRTGSMPITLAPATKRFGSWTERRPSTTLRPWRFREVHLQPQAV